MDQKLQQILDNLPQDEPRSRLEPYREFILKLRRRGRSYRRIRNILADTCAVQVSQTALVAFIKRRNRPRSIQPPVTELPPLEQPERKPMGGREENVIPRRSPEEIAAMRAAASAANHKPVFHLEEPRPRFEYDPDRPLTNKKSQGDLNGSSRSNTNSDT